MGGAQAAPGVTRSGPDPALTGTAGALPGSGKSSSLRGFRRPRNPTREPCPPAPSERGRMTYIIAEPCIDVKDKSCVEVCPVDCIHGTDDDKMLFINPEECIDCGACEPACPVQAIFPEEEVPEKWRGFIQLNYTHFGQTPPG